AVETAEMAGADGAAAEHGRELQLYPGRKAERAFGADQDVREIEIVAAGSQSVEVVAADAALHLRKPRRNLVRLARAEREQIRSKRTQRRIRRQIGKIVRDTAEMRLRAVGKQRIDRDDVLARVAVAQRAAAARIVAGHAADGGARGSRD